MDGIVNVGGSEDYLTQAVTKLNDLYGDINLVEGDNITLEVVDSKIIISSSVGSGGGVTEIPQANEIDLGGIRAKARVDEQQEVSIDTTTGKLYVPLSEDNSGGLIEIPQATDTDLGGIRANERLDEDVEVKIDPTTGKLYVPTPDISNLPIPDIHGLPPGGKAGQILMKVDNTDYNVVWVDPPTSGGSSTLSQIDFFKISDVKINESLTLTNIDIPEEV